MTKRSAISSAVRTAATLVLCFCVQGAPSPPSTAVSPSTGTTTTDCSATAASTVLVGGCVVDGGAGVQIHYKLEGNPPDRVAIALQAQTTGYVAMGFTDGHQSMYPTDAVIGWTGSSGTNIQSYRIDGYSVSDVVPDATVQLTNQSATEVNGVTTVMFTRMLNAGRYPVNPNAMTFNVARGRGDVLAQHIDATSGSISLQTGTVSLTGTQARDKFWVTHGVLMVAAWALFVPHAVGFAKFKAKWGDILKNDSMWFHLHRLLQLIAFIAHVVSIVIAVTKFGEYTEDLTLHLHAAFAWIVTGLLGVQWIVALFLRPVKTAPRRPMWNLFHFNAARAMLLLALANIGIGIYLYQRKTGPLLISTGVWVAITLASLATALVHLVLLAIRRSPPAKEDIIVPQSESGKDPEIALPTWNATA